MHPNQQFAVSVHILTVLAAHPDVVVTSDFIADSVNTNPVVIRRIMSHLRERGLVDSRSGLNGGWKLVRSPEQISLREVYHSVCQGDVLSLHKHPNPSCPVGGKIRGALLPVFDDAQNAMEVSLDKFTVADILNRVFSPVVK